MAGATTALQRRLRLKTGDLGLMALAIAGFVGESAVYLGSNSLPVAPEMRFLLSEAVYLVPMVLVIVLGRFVSRSASGVEARFWIFAASATAVLVASESYYAWWVVTVDAAGPPPVFAPFQIMHIAAAVLFLAAVMSMTKFQNTTATVMWRYLLDAAGVAVIAFVLLLEFVVKPMLADVPTVSHIETVAGAAYMTLGLGMLAGTFLILVGFKVSRWRPWEVLVAMSMGIYAMGTAAWPVWLLAAQPGERNLGRGILDLVLALGYYLFFIAAVYRMSRRDQQWPLRPVPLFQPARHRTFGVLLPAMSMVGVLATAYVAFRIGPTSSDFAVYVGVMSVLSVVVVARTTVIGIEGGRLLHRSMTDPLTGLFGIRFMHERLAVELGIARRYGERLSVLVLDIDGFALVNDLYGHPAGDEVLAAFGAAVREASGESAVACRIGGDEFAVILPTTTVAEAIAVCERIRHSVEALRPRDGFRVSASMGVATYPDHASTAEDLIRKAEGARYWVKRHGKDRVLVYDPSIVTDLGADDRIRALEEQWHLGAVRALAAAVDARDPATSDRSVRVAALTARTARELGMDETRVRVLESAALVFDVGMIGVPEELASRPGRLSSEERVRLAEHPVLSERILSSTPMRQMLPWIRHHHERWDGTGYPDGLRAVAIPLESRVLAVCSAYEAMISPRPWRGPMTDAEAMSELASGAGSEFDPAVVDVFRAMLAGETAAR